MRTLDLDRILVLTGIFLLLIFLAFDVAFFNVVIDKELGASARSGSGAEVRYQKDPFKDVLVPTRPAEALQATAFRAPRLDVPTDEFFTTEERAAYRQRAQRAVQLAKALAPPLGLKAVQRGQAVLLEWAPNPANEMLKEQQPTEPDGGSLQTAGYQIYRWRGGEPPTAIAIGNLDTTSFLDTGLGPRGGLVHYSVKTVLKNRIGPLETLRESVQSEPLAIEVADSFQLALLGGDEGKASLEVKVVPGDRELSHVFDVVPGAPVGAAIDVAADGAAPARIDFFTGLTVESIHVIADEVQRTVHNPVFNPDGSRATDENGFKFNDEIETVTVHRLEVRCTGGPTGSRVLNLDRP